LPSANGAVPDAHEWPAYGSNVRRSGKWAVSLELSLPPLAEEPMSAASRFKTGAYLWARAGSLAAKTAAAYRK
jgi:hypothetical protein